MDPRAHTSETNAALEMPEQFLRDIERVAPLPEHVSAADAAVGVLCTLTARLSGGEARDLQDALPRSLQPLLKRCMRHEREPGEVFGREEFVERVAQHAGVDRPAAEGIVSAVFSALRARLPSKEDVDVTSQLPRDLKRLWTASVPSLSAHSESAPPGEATPGWHRVLGDIEQSGTLVPSISSGQAFAVVMCALMRRISRGEASDVVQAMPLPLRPLLDPCAQRGEERGETFDRGEFIGRVAHQLHATQSEAEEAARAVFAAVQRVMTPKEVSDVERQLPLDLKVIWSDPEGLGRR